MKRILMQMCLEPFCEDRDVLMADSQSMSDLTTSPVTASYTTLVPSTTSGRQPSSLPIHCHATFLRLVVKSIQDIEGFGSSIDSMGLFSQPIRPRLLQQIQKQLEGLSPSTLQLAALHGRNNPTGETSPWYTQSLSSVFLTVCHDWTLWAMEAHLVQSLFLALSPTPSNEATRTADIPPSPLLGHVSTLLARVHGPHGAAQGVDMGDEQVKGFTDWLKQTPVLSLFDHFYRTDCFPQGVRGIETTGQPMSTSVSPSDVHDIYHAIQTWTVYYPSTAIAFRSLLKPLIYSVCEYLPYCFIPYLVTENHFLAYTTALRLLSTLEPSQQHTDESSHWFHGPDPGADTHGTPQSRIPRLSTLTPREKPAHLASAAPDLPLNKDRLMEILTDTSLHSIYHFFRPFYTRQDVSAVGNTSGPSNDSMTPLRLKYSPLTPVQYVIWISEFYTRVIRLFDASPAPQRSPCSAPTQSESSSGDGPGVLPHLSFHCPPFLFSSHMMVTTPILPLLLNQVSSPLSSILIPFCTHSPNTDVLDSLRDVPCHSTALSEELDPKSTLIPLADKLCLLQRFACLLLEADAMNEQVKQLHVQDGECPPDTITDQQHFTPFTLIFAEHVYLSLARILFQLSEQLLPSSESSSNIVMKPRGGGSVAPQRGLAKPSATIQQHLRLLRPIAACHDEPDSDDGWMQSHDKKNTPTIDRLFIHMLGAVCSHYNAIIYSLFSPMTNKKLISNGQATHLLGHHTMRWLSAPLGDNTRVLDTHARSAIAQIAPQMRRGLTAAIMGSIPFDESLYNIVATELFQLFHFYPVLDQMKDYMARRTSSSSTEDCSSPKYPSMTLLSHVETIHAIFFPSDTTIQLLASTYGHDTRLPRDHIEDQDLESSLSPPQKRQRMSSLPPPASTSFVLTAHDLLKAGVNKSALFQKHQVRLLYTWLQSVGLDGPYAVLLHPHLDGQLQQKHLNIDLQKAFALARQMFVMWCPYTTDNHSFAIGAIATRELHQVMCGVVSVADYIWLLGALFPDNLTQPWDSHSQGKETTTSHPQNATTQGHTNTKPIYHDIMSLSANETSQRVWLLQTIFTLLEVMHQTLDMSDMLRQYQYALAHRMVYIFSEQSLLYHTKQMLLGFLKSAPEPVHPPTSQETSSPSHVSLYPLSGSISCLSMSPSMLLALEWSSMNAWSRFVPKDVLHQNLTLLSCLGRFEHRSGGARPPNQLPSQPNTPSHQHPASEVLSSTSLSEPDAELNIDSLMDDIIDMVSSSLAIQLQDGDADGAQHQHNPQDQDGDIHLTVQLCNVQSWPLSIKAMQELSPIRQRHPSDGSNELLNQMNDDAAPSSSGSSSKLYFPPELMGYLPQSCRNAIMNFEKGYVSRNPRNILHYAVLASTFIIHFDPQRLLSYMPSSEQHTTQTLTTHPVIMSVPFMLMILIRVVETILDGHRQDPHRPAGTYHFFTVGELLKACPYVKPSFILDALGAATRPHQPSPQCDGDLEDFTPTLFMYVDSSKQKQCISSLSTQLALAPVLYPPASQACMPCVQNSHLMTSLQLQQNCISDALCRSMITQNNAMTGSTRHLLAMDELTHTPHTPTPQDKPGADLPLSDDFRLPSAFPRPVVFRNGIISPSANCRTMAGMTPSVSPFVDWDHLTNQDIERCDVNDGRSILDVLRQLYPEANLHSVDEQHHAPDIASPDDLLQQSISRNKQLHATRCKLGVQATVMKQLKQRKSIPYNELLQDVGAICFEQLGMAIAPEDVKETIEFLIDSDYAERVCIEDGESSSSHSFEIRYVA